MSYWRTCASCGKTYSNRLSGAKGYVTCSFTCEKELRPTKANTRSKPTTYNSRRQEKRSAKDGGGRQVLASGALPGRPGDVLLKDWMLECKTTATMSYRFTKHGWQSHCIDASLAGRKPAFEISLDGEELIVISRDEFFNLIQE
jgi:hypothetical protein